MAGLDNTPAPPVQLTVSELRLLVKLGEQNDNNANYGQRQGGIRLRTSLMGKLYASLDQIETPVEEEEAGDADTPPA